LNLSPEEKAKVLIEAFPYIKNFHGRTVVVKYGGKAMVDEDLREKVMQDIALLNLVGIKVVVVHGGGPQINEYLSRLGIDAHFIGGLRVTDEETMEVVRMVLTGKINRELVAMLTRYGMNAIGLSGEDAGLLEGEKISEELGLVGKVVDVNSTVIRSLLDDGFIPVIASIAVGKDGTILNINADEAASKIASSLEADKLIYLTDVDGVYIDGRLISRLSTSEAEDLVRSGKIAGGMIPKIESVVEAVKSGVSRVHILNGTTPHALLLEIFTDEGIGTMVEA
jgi:acetylglutamate kinase